MKRLLCAILGLLSIAQAAHGTDAIKIIGVGIGGYYRADAPTPVRVLVSHTDKQIAHIELQVEFSARNSDGRVEIQDKYAEQLAIQPNEQRIVEIPALPEFLRDEEVTVWEIDASGKVLAQDTTGLASPLPGEFTAILCATDAGCQQAHMRDLFKRPEDPTNQHKADEFATIENAPDQWWEYECAQRIILARPASDLSKKQRDALEGYARAGGNLIIVQDQARPGDFLNSYQAVASSAVIGRGRIFWVDSLANAVRASATTEVGALASLTETARTFQSLDWGRNRLAAQFPFPTLTWLLVWLSVYLVVAGPLNFALLRKFDKREWAWVTLPALSVLFAAAMYISTSGNRPHELLAEDVAIAWMDGDSPLAFVQHGERISSNRRLKLNLELAQNAGLFEGDHNRTGTRFVSGIFDDSDPNRFFARWDVTLDTATTVRLGMLQWSFRDLDFYAIETEPGTVRRTGDTQLRNETGKNFRQAIFVDPNNVYELGAVSSGAQIDLSAAKKVALSEFVDPLLYAKFGFPTEISVLTQDQAGWNLRSRSLHRQKDEDVEAELKKPFELGEFIRAWPANGGRAFDLRSGLFLGLEDEADPPISIPGQPSSARGYSITIVSFSKPHANATESNQ